MKQSYKKAKAHVVLFDNSDVITTSGVNTENGEHECEKHPGWYRGENCEKNGKSGYCKNKSW